MTSEDYAKLLERPEWRRFRNNFIERFKDDHCGRVWCRHCERETNLNLHHIRYREDRMPWEYEDKDLMILCRPCHERLHKYAKEAEALVFSLTPHIAEEFMVMVDLFRTLSDEQKLAACAIARRAIRDAESPKMNELFHDLA